MQINLVRSFFSVFFGKIGRLVLAMAITPILVRLLGSAKYGEYVFILSLLGISTRIISDGIKDGVRKFIAENRSIEEWESGVLGFYTLFGSALVFITGILVIISNITGITSNLLGRKFIMISYILCIILIFRQFFLIGRSALMGKGLEHISEPLRVVQKLTFGVVGLSLIYLGYGVIGALLGHLLSTFLVFILTTYMISRYFPLRKVFSRRSCEIPKLQLILYNWKSVILLLLTVSLYHTDIILLRILVGQSSTGYYKAALTIAEFLWFVPLVLQTTLLHSSSELSSKEGLLKITKKSSRITRYNVLLILLLSIGIAALSKPFVLLYFGSEFTPSIKPLLLLLPGAICFGIARPIYSTGQGIGDFKPLIAATGMAAFINLLLNIMLIPSHGLMGASIATSIGYTSMLIFHILASHRIGFYPLSNLRISRILVTSSFSALIIFLSAYYIQSSLLSVVIIPPFGFLVYSTTALKTGAIDSEEIHSLVQIIPLPFKNWISKLI